MRLTRVHIISVLFMILAIPVLAQNGTSSPFSRYGYGELNDNVPNTYRALGGVGIGMRGNKVICSAQPASYTACDSLTFMFDLAASVMWSRYADASGMQNKADGNLEYLTLQFPIWKRYIAFSAGLLPYSSVGYDITLSDSIGSAYHFTKRYLGEGSISEVYGGLSFNICHWFALGANVYYMFGETNNARLLTFSESDLTNIIQDGYFHVGSVRFRYGAQFFHTFGNHSFVLGGIFENKRKFNSTYLQVESSLLDTIPQDDDSRCELPMTYGVGGSYSWADRLTIGFDWSRQCMSSILYGGNTATMNDRNRYCFGVEYRHNPQGRKYVERVMWRLGCNVTESYIKEIPSTDFTVSMGVGLPLRNAGTIFNATVEYGHRGNKNILEENYMRLTINASIAEDWFRKRRL